MKLGFLASHGGSAARYIISAARSGEINSTIGPVITNNACSAIRSWCRTNNVDVHYISRKTHPQNAVCDTAILSVLTAAKVDLVVLSGYMKKVGPTTLNHYRNRILNIHPSLLPQYGGQGMYGDRVHKAVLASSDKATGATVQFINADYDEGPVVAQETITVETTDTVASLRDKLKFIEGPLYVRVINKLESEGLV